MLSSMALDCNIHQIEILTIARVMMMAWPNMAQEMDA